MMISNSKRKTQLGSVTLFLVLGLSACRSAPLPPQPTTPLPIPIKEAPATPTPSALPTSTATSVPPTSAPTATETPAPSPTPFSPLSIAWMRQQQYPGSDITIEQTLDPGSNYQRYIASYRSEGLKIYGLLTVPDGPKPPTGWPVIIFNHGYIPPSQYRTTERYVAYVDAIARSGYIVFKSDYRGHGDSEGVATGGYGSPDYTIDVLNALASMKRYPDADPKRIGMWGHSMGGAITLRAMVVSKDIKAGVIWSGVVASYPDLFAKWHPRPGATPLPPPSGQSLGWRNRLIREFGTPEENPQFWGSISPNSYLQDLSGPLQLHATTTDEEVPYVFSQTLNEQVKAVGKSVEFYTYYGDNHNLSNSFGAAMQRTIEFFDRYVKNAPGGQTSNG